MTELKRCRLCGGSGKIMGGGMVYHACQDCDGSGKEKVIEDIIGYLDIKNTDHYKEALSKIQGINPGIDEEKAKQIFEEEFHRVNNAKPKQKKR